jgi:hypothetical protein
MGMFLTRPQPRIELGSRDPFGLFKVALPLVNFDTHLYCVGKTGKGKSSFLTSLAYQLITQDQGVGLIDPHGDLVTDLIAYLASYPVKRPWLADPENRKRIIYFDPLRTDYAMSFNPLAIKRDGAYVSAKSVLEAIRRVWHEELRIAPRFNNLGVHSFMVLVENGLSLIELPRFLTDEDYQRQLLAKVKNERVLDFFHDRFAKWGKEAPLMIESLLNKTTEFTLNEFLYPVTCGSGCLDLRQIMDEGKILLVNLRTKDETTKLLLGSLLMAMIEQATLTREEIPKERRRPFFLLVDEFQKFCANAGSVVTLAEFLSECRKYGLRVIFAHQSWAQIEDFGRLAGAIEQAQVRVSFGVGRKTAQAIVGEMYTPDPEKIKHEVEDEAQQVRTHPQYSPIGEQFEMFTQELQRSKRRYMKLQLPEREGVWSVRTLEVPKPRVSAEQVEQVKTSLARQQPGRPRAELIREIEERRQRDDGHGRNAQGQRGRKKEPDEYEPVDGERKVERVIFSA